MRIEELLEGVKAELAIKIYGEDQKILDFIGTQILILLFYWKYCELYNTTTYFCCFCEKHINPFIIYLNSF